MKNVIAHIFSVTNKLCLPKITNKNNVLWFDIEDWSKIA